MSILVSSCLSCALWLCYFFPYCIIAWVGNVIMCCASICFAWRWGTVVLYLERYYTNN